MSLWVDEYRPSSLNDLDCHKETTKMLEQLVKPDLKLSEIGERNKQ